MDSKQFQRRIEDFICEVCGAQVKGNGYTNHCPQCLHSKHVDVNPGDRASTCGGIMEPIGLEIKGGEQVITHRCQRCGHTRRNKASPADSQEALIRLSRMG